MESSSKAELLAVVVCDSTRLYKNELLASPAGLSATVKVPVCNDYVTLEVSRSVSRTGHVVRRGLSATVNMPVDDNHMPGGAAHIDGWGRSVEYLNTHMFYKKDLFYYPDGRVLGIMSAGCICIETRARKSTGDKGYVMENMTIQLEGPAAGNPTGISSLCCVTLAVDENTDLGSYIRKALQTTTEEI